MAGAGSKNELLALMRDSLPAFNALFKAYLQLAQGGFPAASDEVLDAMERAGVELDAFRRMQAAAAGGKPPGREELARLVEQALAELAGLNRRVDAMDGQQG
jgi:hypothetical protein